ncbi:MAG TPA: hypothetical protein VNC22_23030 [Sporichthya sp.]|jgi:hypothetical protein|nr:hypothetical protein [Sporichthya sp.]
MERVPIKSTPTRRKRIFDEMYARILPSVLARGCEFEVHAWGNLVPVPYAEIRDCRGRLVGHHARGRNLNHPEISNDPANLRCLCDRHHKFVHDHPRWAREVGLMLTRHS